MTNLFAIRLYPISGDSYYFIGAPFIETCYLCIIFIYFVGERGRPTLVGDIKKI